MKKKIFYTIFAMSIIMMMFSVTVFAEQKTELPVTLRNQNAGYDGYPSFTLNSFEVTDVYIVSDSKKRVEFNRSYKDTPNGCTYVRINCYDDAGYLIGPVYFVGWDKYVDIPICTATIEFTMKNPTENSDSYLYRKLVTLYSQDGRSITVTDLEVPQYERVGWSGLVTMYAPVDGVFSRTIEVSPLEVSAYEAVGWYTYEGALFYIFKDYYYNTLKPATDYNSVFDFVEEILPDLIGTKYEQEVYKIRTEAMDLWRKHCGGKPMGLIDYEISKNSIGTPEVTLYFRNLSYKKIVAFKVKFDCYNIFGDLERSYYDSYYIDNSNLDIAGSFYATWTLYGADSVNKVKNIRVIEVVYEDGTKWYGK